MFLYCCYFFFFISKLALLKYENVILFYSILLIHPVVNSPEVQMRPVYESSAREMFTVGQNTMKFFAICLFIWSFMSSITALSDVTGSVLTDKAGMIAAFGDFNGDKHADIFVIAANGAYFRLEHIFDIKSKH